MVAVVATTGTAKHTKLQYPVILPPTTLKCFTGHVTVQYHLRPISLLNPATPENISVPATTASTTLITVSWSSTQLNSSLFAKNTMVQKYKR